MAVKIALSPGDGIGPEIAETLPPLARAINEAAGDSLVSLTVPRDDHGVPCTHEYFLNTGSAMPEGFMARLRQEYDGIIAMPIGGKADPAKGVTGMEHGRPWVIGRRTFFDTAFSERPCQPLTDALALKPHPEPVLFKQYVLSERDHTVSEHKIDGGVECVIRMNPAAIRSLLLTAIDHANRDGCPEGRRDSEGRIRIALVLKHNALPHLHGSWLAIAKELNEEFGRSKGIVIEPRLIDSFVEGLIAAPHRQPYYVVSDRSFAEILEPTLTALQRGDRAMTPGGLHLMVGRQNTMGLYVGEGGKAQIGEVSYGEQIGRYSDDAIAKNVSTALRRATELGLERACVVLPDSLLPLQRLRWTEVARTVAGGSPLDFITIDEFIRRVAVDPRSVDGAVYAAGNLEGDIITDATSALEGGLGVSPCLAYSDTWADAGPTGGSAPDIVGKGIANPVATILSFGMLLARQELGAEAQALRNAAESVTERGISTPDIGGRSSTAEVGEAIGTAFSAELRTLYRHSHR